MNKLFNSKKYSTCSLVTICMFCSAQELLRNKGICSNAWKEWEESSRTLPKIGGSKEFEPNGSWLEKKQIEKGLNSREFLLGIERVERSSQLASAEWLPEQKHARVTKKVGNDWANFGHEINSSLYLIPEEALILLETVSSHYVSPTLATKSFYMSNNKNFLRQKKIFL